MHADPHPTTTCKEEITMYLGTYRFTGDPIELAAAYDRLMAKYPDDQLLVHVCVRTDEGLVVYDTCPSQADFHAFSTDPQLLAAMHEAGLPTPQVEEVGEVHRAKAPALVRS
jgi:hypothetical protein